MPKFVRKLISEEMTFSGVCNSNSSYALEWGSDLEIGKVIEKLEELKNAGWETITVKQVGKDWYDEYVTVLSKYRIETDEELESRIKQSQLNSKLKRIQKSGDGAIYDKIEREEYERLKAKFG